VLSYNAVCIHNSSQPQLCKNYLIIYYISFTHMHTTHTHSHLQSTLQFHIQEQNILIHIHTHTTLHSTYSEIYLYTYTHSHSHLQSTSHFHIQERNSLLGGNKQEMQELFDKRSKMEADFMDRCALANPLTTACANIETSIDQ
jgi:hypothetical protein